MKQEKKSTKPNIKRLISSNKPFEQKANLTKLSLQITVVNSGIGINIVKLMETLGCSYSFVHRGEGTASKEVSSVLGFSEKGKDIVFSFVKENSLKEISKELEAFFKVNKKNQGISFAIPLSTIMGVRIYKFLTQTL